MKIILQPRGIIPGLLLIFLVMIFPINLKSALPAAEKPQEKLLIEVLDEISRDYQVYFTYDADIIKGIVVDYVKREGESVGSILSRVLVEVNMDFKIFEDRFVILYRKDEAGLRSLEKMISHMEEIVKDRKELFASRRNSPIARLRLDDWAEINRKRLVLNITGRVIDSNGEPLIGVNILVKGTNKGTTTDIDGRFSLTDINDQAVLVLSYIGYESQEVPVNGQISLTIIMKEDVQTLDEVVVVGYGTQKKVNLTGSVSTIDFVGALENRPITNASQALGGQASGVWVSQNSGKPGSDGAQIRIRGWGTLNNPNPLVLVDGVEGTFSQINPNDIESISILKDAASAAIYGSKAANGVVLVTTKMAKTGEQMRVSLSSYYGIQSLGRHFEMIDNSAEFMQLWNKALINGGGSPLFSESMINNFSNGTDPYKYPSTDWFDVLFENSAIHEHNLSISGGSEKTTSYLSFNYLDQVGMVPNTTSNRYSIRANIESQASSRIKISGRLNYIKRTSMEPYADITYGSLGRVFTMLGGAAPFISPYTREGRFGSVEAIDENGNFLYDNRNPLIDAANGRTMTDVSMLGINASAEVLLSQSLTWKTTVASNGDWELTDRYNESVFGYTDSGIETITKNFNREGIEINRGQITSISNNLFSTLNFNKNIATIHTISSVVGLQLEDLKIKNLYSRRSEPPKEGLSQVDAGTSGIQGEGNFNALRIFSYFGRINYSLFDRYLFEANLRADGSSRFDKENRWGVFPGFSAGWRISEESFLKDLNWLSNLKMRVSWGELGNQSISGYWPYLTVINQSNSLSYSYNGNFAPGAAITALIDNSITWEITSSLDFGVDIGFLNNRLNIEADYFNKVTRDIIVQLPIPNIMGDLTPPFENVGEMLNRGFEVVVNYSSVALRRDQLDFRLGMNLTYIENEVTKFRGGNSPDQLYLIREGHPYRTLYGYKAIGVYQSNEEAAEHMHSNSFTPQAGNLKFEDVNNDGRLGFEDKLAIGNTIPKYTFGLNGGLTYKGFDLNILFQGILGVNAYTQSIFTNVTDDNPTMTTKWRNAWSPDNPNSDIPSIKFNNTWDQSQSSFWVHNISFVKLKNVQVGYALPADKMNIGIRKIYAYINAQNLFTVVNEDYEGYDPERNTFNSGDNMYPVPRIISFGLNVTL